MSPDVAIDAKNTAMEAYVFGYPLVLMDATRAKMTNTPRTMSTGLAPINQFSHVATFPDATFTDVVTPNADTLYSFAWLDLTGEPVVLSLPDTHSRYYVMQMLDAWTNVFAAPGKRTTGTAQESFAITGPHWKGSMPAELKEIKSPTDMVWILGRTQTNGKADFAAVHAIQAEYKLVPLSAWNKPYTPPSDVPTDPAVNMKTPPVGVVAAMDASTFFNQLARLMKNNPPAADDASMVAKLASIGVISGKAFDLNGKGANTAKAIVAGVDEGKKRVLELGQNPGIGKIINGWLTAVKDIGSYGTNYNARAGVAWVGLGANLPEDAIYPLVRIDSDGKPLNGANQYVIHFSKGQTPPVNAFWSVTMYNSRQAFVANPLNRYAIGDRDPLQFNPDGSLDIYLQHDSPGKEKEPNWLPSDSGAFSLALRMYWPKKVLLDGAWEPPPIKKAA